MVFKPAAGALALAPFLASAAPGTSNCTVSLHFQRLDSTGPTHLYGIDYYTTLAEPTSQAYCDFWDKHHKSYDTQYDCASDGMVHVRWADTVESNIEMNKLLDESLALWGKEMGCAVGDDH